MAPHRIDVDEMFHAFHAYALLNNVDHKKTSGESVSGMLEPSICDKHFSKFLLKFKYGIRGLTYYLDMPKSLGLTKKLCFIMVPEEGGRVGCRLGLISVSSPPKLSLVSTSF